MLANQDVFDRIEIVGLMAQCFRNRGLDLIRRIGPIKLQYADKFPRASRVAVAMPQRLQHDFVVAMPLGAPLPDRPGAFERSSASIKSR